MSLAKSRIPGFYKLPLAQRREILCQNFRMSEQEVRALDAATGLAPETADHMVENAIGVFGLPLGIGLNFVVNGAPVLVPMAVEEPSVVAAVSHIAKLANDGGGFRTDCDAPRMVGQVQLLDVPNLEEAESRILESADLLMAHANGFCEGLVNRGGGCQGIEVRRLPPVQDGEHADLDSAEDMLIVHVIVDCRDAMGANAINTVVEGIAPRLEKLSGGRALLRILSNLSDRRCARAAVRIPYASLVASDESHGAVPSAAGRNIAAAIVDAYRFAARDPYRACTHNKGIMNGIDAVAIATGNDWRAIEAGAHAFAARSGRYSSLTRYWLDDDTEALCGSIELPMAVGVVGGSTTVHPTVRACRKLLGRFAEQADKLGGLIAAVGLSQNLGALKALATEGIQRGHMSLHARQIALAAGATGDEIDEVADQLVSEGAIRQTRAEELLSLHRREAVCAS